MSTWPLVVLQLLTLAGMIALLVALLRNRTKSNQDALATELLETVDRTEKALGEFAAKQEAFASRSAQDVSTLRLELVNTLTSQSSNLRQEVTNAIASLGDQTRLTLEALRKAITERQDQLAQDLNKGQTELLETVNNRLNEFQTGSSEKFSGFQKTQLEQGASLRETIDNTLSRLGRDLREAVTELKTEVKERLDAVAVQTTALAKSAEDQQTSLRTTVEQKLDKLNESNAKKLDEMRETVDEKLHKTLESRLTESFGLVTDQLSKVQTGLGEMKDLAVNVGDLKRVFNNVSTRGAVGELWLGKQLEEKLAPDQFVKNARIRPDSDERVDYAIRIPNGDGEPILLPIDAKFPKEDWERLEDAAKIGDAQGVETARKGLEARIKLEAKKIKEKYIFPPITMPFALMYFPSEGLFSEALRIPGLVDEIQLKYNVNLVAPTNFMAVLNSLQMGFKTLAIQKKSSEVWQILATTKVEFQNFGVLMTKVEKQVGTVQNTIKDVNSKTRTINRKLRGVEVLEMGPVAAVPPIELDAEGALFLGTPAELGNSLEGEPGLGEDDSE